MITLTIKECEATQIRHEDGYGIKHPYKGRWHDSASPYPVPEAELPEGWVFIRIPMWGIYIRRKDDINYMKDLN